MAQINIERKKTSIWPWIIGLILLALIAWAVYEFGYKQQMHREVTDPNRPTTGQVLPIDQLQLAA